MCGAIHHHRCLKDKSFFVKKGSHSTIYPNPKYHNKSGKLDLCNILYSIGVVFKIDFEKAYDHVRWDFLDQVLEKKGFSPKWRKWMSGCLSSVSYAVLVNGSAKGWVKASRGLRQGDPLSSFLFTLIADVLSRMLLRAEERNMLEGFRVGRNRTRVSHLQFVDDTIFFSNTREEDLQTLKSLLLAFGHISGLKVNLDKSNIYGINLDQAHISRLAETLG